tara:strand:+ start:759 stop:962 length:204 start_codon:yes stop_codon:yes gene_type:complete
LVNFNSASLTDLERDMKSGLLIIFFAFCSCKNLAVAAALTAVALTRFSVVKPEGTPLFLIYPSVIPT